MQRRILMHLLLAGTACVLPACGRERARGEVLRALIERIVVPNTTALAEHSRRLEVESAGLVADPTPSTLRDVRQSWRRALSSWKRVEAFRLGPIAESNSLMRAMFWPVRAAGLEGLLQGAQTLDHASVDSMGVDRRGLFALEYLLFSEAAEEECAARFAGPAGERRASLARALAGNVSFHADNLVRSLGSGKTFADKLADGGQDSLNRLVAQLVFTVENVSANRLARTSRLVKTSTFKRSDTEGGLSGTSREIALTYLRATQQLYLGEERGLCRLVSAQSATVDRALRSAFAQAIIAVADLGGPLEEAAQRDPGRFDAAADSVKKLERTLKVDLASVLGVTSTFASVDGD